MTGERDNGGGGGDLPGDAVPPPPERPVTLRRVVGPIAGHGESAPPAVQLVREYKGLTVADLNRDEIVERLPGQVRAALHHLERGDFAAAERALPGSFAPLLPGPGARGGRRRRLRRSTVVWLVVTATLLGATLASYWF